MVSTNLRAAIDQATYQMQAHPRHNLLPYYRNAIYLALPEPRHTRSQRLRYGWLEVITARHVFPLWQQWCEHYRPDDTRAELLLTQAEQVMQGTESVQTFRQKADEAWWWFMDSRYLGEDAEVPPRPSLSAFASISRACLTVAELVRVLDEGIEIDMDGEAHGNLLNEEDEDDQITDPWSADAALWAVDALTQVAFWTDADQSAASLTFWTWWLTEAIPTAWKTAA